MGLESATMIHQLDPNNPTGADPKNQGDDHFRMMKTCLLTSLPNIDGVMTASHTELNLMVGATLAMSTLVTGSYTPTLTAISNLTGLTNIGHFYMRLGNMVLAVGQVSATVTVASGTTTRFRATLPVASNFVGGGGEAIGLVIGYPSGTNSNVGQVGAFNAVPDLLDVLFDAGIGGAQTINYMVLYRVL